MPCKYWGGMTCNVKVGMGLQYHTTPQTQGRTYKTLITTGKCIKQIKLSVIIIIIFFLFLIKEEINEVKEVTGLIHMDVALSPL
ncbi:hypothetical protein LguiA_001970 [Lonicera macranthoides]